MEELLEDLDKREVILKDAIIREVLREVNRDTLLGLAGELEMVLKLKAKYEPKD